MKWKKNVTLFPRLNQNGTTHCHWFFSTTILGTTRVNWWQSVVYLWFNWKKIMPRFQLKKTCHNTTFPTKSKLHPSEILKSRNFWWKLLISSVLWDLRFLIKGLVDNCNCGFEWVTALITVFFENLQGRRNQSKGGRGEFPPSPYTVY